MLERLRIAFVASSLGILTLVSACTTSLPGDFCEVYEPVYVTAQDREQMDADTLEVLMGNNAVWKELCDKTR